MSQEFILKRRWGTVAINVDDDNFLRMGESGDVRSWSFYRLLNETIADLEAMDAAKDQFASGSDRPLIGDTEWRSESASYTEGQLVIAGQQVMQAWETDLMAAMAEVAASAHGDVLEVGFGMGISASLIQERGVSSHTIIELNEQVFARAEEWRRDLPDANIHLICDPWQEAVRTLEKFDAVFFDIYPVSDLEVMDWIDVPFPSDFFGIAAQLLKEGGVFTYYTNEIDSLSRWHQRQLLKYFRRFTVAVVTGLNPPKDCHYWWAPSMAVVAAYL